MSGAAELSYPPPSGLGYCRSARRGKIKGGRRIGSHFIPRGPPSPVPGRSGCAPRTRDGPQAFCRKFHNRLGFRRASPLSSPLFRIRFGGGERGGRRKGTFTIFAALGGERGHLPFLRSRGPQKW